MATKEIDWTQQTDAVKLYSAIHEEPAWMMELRVKALENMNHLALPHIERAKIDRWNLTTPAISEEDEVFSGDVADFTATGDGPMIVIQNDQLVFSQLPQDLANQGVILTDLFTALREHGELVKEYFMTKAVKPDEDRLAAFHAAFMSNGVFLFVPKNTQIVSPIEVTYLHSGESSRVFAPHILIVAEENSEFSYLERVQTHGVSTAKTSGSVVAEVIAKAGAKIKYAAVDQLGAKTTSYVNRRGFLERDASIDWALGIMNDGDVVADFDSDLVGAGSHSEVKAVAISSGKQKQIIDTRVTNFAPYSIGHILQHGVILDAATLTFNGIGHIIKGAKGADAQQESRVLMLSDKARGDANPILLIDENEVTAGHAASVGRVDPEEMYYLMSRGITKAEAERLVIRGFLGTVLTSIPVKSVRDGLVAVMEGKLIDGTRQ